MRTTLRSIIAIALALAAIAPALYPASANPVPVPGAPVVAVPGDRLTQDEITKLQVSLATLLDLLNKQGETLKANDTKLDKIDFRTETYLPVDLKPVNAEFVKIIDHIDSITTALAANGTAGDKQAAEEKAALDALAAELTKLQGQMSALDISSAELTKLRSDVAGFAVRPAPATPVAADTSVLLTPVLVTAAVCTLLLAGVVFLAGRGQRQENQAMRENLLAALSQARDQIQMSLKTGLQTSASELGSTISGNQQTVAEPLARMQSLIERLEKQEQNRDDMPTREFPRVVPPDEATTIPRRAPAEPRGPAASLWPAAFLAAGSPLAWWCARLESQLASPEHQALPVFSALLALRVLCERPGATASEVADAVAVFSQAAHAYWNNLADLSSDDRLRASAEWIQGIKSLIATAAPKLDLREIVPGARFDPDTMQTVEEGPGNHLNVAAVFSWAILDRSGERPKVLHRARIATT
jgi:hypothetical protein